MFKKAIALGAASLVAGTGAAVGVQASQPEEAKAYIWYLINSRNSDRAFHAYSERDCTGNKLKIEPGSMSTHMLNKSWRVPPYTNVYNIYGKLTHQTGKYSVCYNFSKLPDITEIKKLRSR